MFSLKIIVYVYVVEFVLYEYDNQLVGPTWTNA